MRASADQNRSDGSRRRRCPRSGGQRCHWEAVRRLPGFFRHRNGLLLKMFTAIRSSGIERSVLVSIGWRSIRTSSYSTFRRWEGGSADYINVLDGNIGDVVREVYFSNRSHDTQYPVSGPIFQETKAEDGSGNYLYLIDPNSYAVSRVGPYSGILGPYAVDSTSSYAVTNVRNLWGMQIANLKSGEIITATIPNHPPGDAGLLHGIAWTPDQSEVWENSSGSDPHVYIWRMLNPTSPILKDKLALRSGRGSHWLTFDVKGNYGYVAPIKNSDDGTEIFNARTHASVGVIGSSEDMLEIDFANGKISQVGDQYGIGRR